MSDHVDKNIQNSNPEVPEKASRRRFDAAYKMKILEEADRCSEPGQLGALLRREGLYSSLLSTWRKQRDQAALDGLQSQKRGRMTRRQDASARELERLQKENERLKHRLQQAETIIDVQKTSLRNLENGTDRERRERMIMEAEKLANQVGVCQACEALGVPHASLYRHRKWQDSTTPAAGLLNIAMNGRSRTGVLGNGCSTPRAELSPSFIDKSRQSSERLPLG